MTFIWRTSRHEWWMSGHFVLLIKSGNHLIECNPGQGAVFKWMSKVFTQQRLLCLVHYWLKNLPPVFQPTRSYTETKRTNFNFVIFPALLVGYGYLLVILIGSLRCLPLFWLVGVVTGWLFLVDFSIVIWKPLYICFCHCYSQGIRLSLPWKDHSAIVLLSPECTLSSVRHNCFYLSIVWRSRTSSPNPSTPTTSREPFLWKLVRWHMLDFGLECTDIYFTAACGCGSKKQNCYKKFILSSDFAERISYHRETNNNVMNQRGEHPVILGRDSDILKIRVPLTRPLQRPSKRIGGILYILYLTGRLLVQALYCWPTGDSTHESENLIDH